QVCAEEGTDISDLRSQPLTAALVDRATHIFAMTGAHLETIQTLFPHGAEKSFLLREFEEPGTTVWRDVPDPIGLGREVYEDCAGRKTSAGKHRIDRFRKFYQPRGYGSSRQRSHEQIRRGLSSKTLVRRL